jgi:hypothetical protein
MIEFDCEEVKRQMNRLVDALPIEDVDIWIKHESGCLKFTAYLRGRDGLSSESDSGDNLEDCVSTVIKKAGPRDEQAIFRVKRLAVEKARAELAILESELDPLVMAVDKAQCESQPVNSTQESK